MTITVRGESRVTHAPERGTVHLSAAADGDARSTVVASATAAAAVVTAQLRELSAQGAVEEWSSAQAAVWVDRPWPGSEPASVPVHHADIRISAVFADLAALPVWLDGVAADERCRIHAVEWALGERTRARLERETAAAAIRDAHERAAAYADAVGRGGVEPVEIADVGLLGATDGAHERSFARTAMADAAAPGFGFTPADVVVTAAVDVRFRTL